MDLFNEEELAKVLKVRFEKSWKDSLESHKKLSKKEISENYYYAGYMTCMMEVKEYLDKIKK